jgi:hypothetical protein
MADIRCDNKKFGELTDDGVIEVKCSSKFCGAAPGVVVIHRFDPLSGELVQTKRFRDPVPVVIEEVQENDHANFAAIRPT